MEHWVQQEKRDLPHTKKLPYDYEQIYQQKHYKVEGSGMEH